MKKTILLVMTILALCSFAGCGSGGGTEALPTSEAETQSGASASPAPASGSGSTDAKALVVYFSWSGNTEAVAAAIQSQTGAELFEIVPQTPYSDDYNTLLDDAQEEQSSDARPAISGTIENLEQYDVIYVGFPNWWGDMPMILYSFLEQYDFSGKTLIPFCTHGGSGFSRTIRTMQDKQPGATVIRNGYSLSRSRMERAPSGVAEWLKEIGLKK